MKIEFVSGDALKPRARLARNTGACFIANRSDNFYPMKLYLGKGMLGQCAHASQSESFARF